MPIYLFKNPNTGKTISVFQAMNDDHTYSEEGIKYERVFTIPNAQIDTEFGLDSSSKFVEKTGKMKGTLGEILGPMRHARAWTRLSLKSMHGRK